MIFGETRGSKSLVLGGPLGFELCGHPVACWQVCGQAPGPGSSAGASGADGRRGADASLPFLAKLLRIGLLFYKVTGTVPVPWRPLLSPHRVACWRRAHLPTGQEGSPVPLCLFWGPVHPQTLWRTLALTGSCPHSCPRAPLTPPVPRPSGRVGSELRSALGHGHTGRPAVLGAFCKRQ